MKDRTDTYERYLLAAWAILFLGCYCFLKFRFGLLLLDDAYITMSHARTWAETGVAVMSPRNPVNGTSTPLFTALLAAIVRIFGTAHFEGIVYSVSVFFDLLILWLVYCIARELRITLPLSLLTVSAVGTSIGFIEISASGMESMLYTAIALAGIYVMVNGSEKNPWAVIVVFLAPLIRPEGVLISGVVILVYLYRFRRIRPLLSLVIASALGILAFVSFYLLSYGKPFPHSIIAKNSFVNIAFPQAVITWIDGLFFKGPLFGGRRITLLSNSALIVAAAAGYIKERDLEHGVLLVSWPFLYMGFFFITGKSDSAYPWYFFPVLPVIICAIMYGISRVIERFNWERIVWSALFILMTLWTVNPVIQDLPRKYKRMVASREGRYKKVIESINTEAKETETILCYDVGVIGYYSKSHILDAVGLISAEVIPYLNRYGWVPEYYHYLINEFEPEWVIMVGGVTPDQKEATVSDTVNENYIRFGSFLARENTDLCEIWRRLP